MRSTTDDPDFPAFKANHRHYLTHHSKFREVVHIQDETIRRKIHHTYRLQYLKDVVLARILDDPTFSILNSIIFFNHVDIVKHLHSNTAIIEELFRVFSPSTHESSGSSDQRRTDAVLFIQQCCAVAKNIQAQPRTALYGSFLQNDVFSVVTYALRHGETAVRIAGTEILVAFIDHDPALMRSLIFRQISSRATPLTDTLIELLLREADFGVKSQMAEALRVLLDPSSNTTAEAYAKANTEFVGRAAAPAPVNPQTDAFIQHFYEESAVKLYKPLIDLPSRSSGEQ
jgi:protein phosphatase-4 regulatory subunit 3